MRQQHQGWEIVVFVLAGVLLTCWLTSCNPVKQAQKDAAKADQQNLALAKLCAERFPSVPSTRTEPGTVDTAGLIKWWLDNNPYYRPLGNEGISGTAETLPTVTNRGSITPRPEYRPAKPISKDSLVVALKRYIKPDHTYETKPDSPLIVALKGDLKAARDLLDPVKKKVTDLDLKLAKSEGKATARLWMFIASLVANAGMLFAYFKGKGIVTAAKRLFKTNA